MLTNAEDPASLQENSFGELTGGYTGVVPPDGLPRSCKATQNKDGIAWEIKGVNLSAWQLAPAPPSTRYLLRWNFLYEGAVTAGGGRTGFIFGNPSSSNLMSVEVTAAGSLRLIMWGRQGFEKHGRIVFSRQTSAKGPSVKIVVSYDIRNKTMDCWVNEGEKIHIDLKTIVPSAPITILGVGFFSAVPESTGSFGRSRRGWESDYDINLSPRWTKTLHKKFAVYAE